MTFIFHFSTTGHCQIGHNTVLIWLSGFQTVKARPFRHTVFHGNSEQKVLETYALLKRTVLLKMTSFYVVSEAVHCKVFLSRFCEKSCFGIGPNRDGGM